MSAGPPQARVNELHGAAAVPRRNGELVFEAPWEGRAFGLAVALSEQQLYAWDDFRQRLIDEIARADARASPTGYYERWLAALESVLVGRGLLSEAELEARTAELAAVDEDDSAHHHPD